MFTFPHDISAELLVSFTLNCVQLGYKLPHVVQLIKLKVKELNSADNFEQIKGLKRKFTVSKQKRRSSLNVLGATSPVPCTLEDIEGGEVS